MKFMKMQFFYPFKVSALCRDVKITNFKEYFDINVGLFKTKPLKAVDDVSFTIKKGETLGLVGESGCGKTTVGRTILHLYKPTAGEIIYKGKPIKTKEDVRQFRKKATMVFQDPYSSLDPRMTVSDIIGEPMDIHKMYSGKAERRERILALMDKVGLNSEHASRYAHEFSGLAKWAQDETGALVIMPDCAEELVEGVVNEDGTVTYMLDDSVEGFYSNPLGYKYFMYCTIG